MTKNREEQVGRLGKVLLVTLLMVAALAAVFDFYYDLNDDTTIKDIISGAYTGIPSGYSIQLLYPLSALLAFFYKVIPGVPWYGLFLCLCQFASFALMAWRTTIIIQEKKKQMLCLLLEALFFTGLLIRQLVIVQYSVTSGICMATAVFLYVTARKGEGLWQELSQNGTAVVLVLLSFMIRTEMCLMLTPFLLLAGLTKWLSEKEALTWRILRKYVAIAATAALGMLALHQVDYLYYHQAVQQEEGWPGFLRFFEARTQLYDFYDIPDYDSNIEFYQSIGLSRESYTLLENYNFALDDSIDEHLLEKIAAYQQQQADAGGELHRTFSFLYTKNTFKEAIWLYRRHIMQGRDGIGGIVVCACYLLYAFLGLGENKGKGRYEKAGIYGKMLGLLFIRSMLWLYLFLVDRVLDRITYPLLITELVLLLGWILQEKRPRFYQGLLAGVLSLCSVALLFQNGTQTYEEYEKREQINARWEALIAYCSGQEDNFYIIDVYSSTSYQGIPYSEKLFQNVDNSLRNFDLCGGWLTKSPLTNQKLDSLNIAKLETALYSREETQGRNAYFVADCDKNLDWLVSYYRYKGEEVEPRQVDTIMEGDTPAFAVYELQQGMK